ncbi:MAG: dihydropteroate synthase [Deltaproteobacteria bacterium]|nr:dihydropteroate synthase [Deltaproteobacteria bacterium]MBW1818959.1 dihydropteroate synthase [Deltaproteobacteria bacterium]MBW2282967.1 dihydropteroate synthase [Deltaproteobacteria bacterium]
MGVLNVTPDSFSDGGRYFQTEAAVRQGIRMVREGAHIIDVGGESTRPFSEAVSSREEMERVIPVIKALSRKIDRPISIDTTKADVAEAALDAGAAIVNDISALRFDARLAAVAAGAGVPVVLMHMKGTPGDMQKNPGYGNLISEIIDFLGEAKGRAAAAGVREDLIVLDPGIGFGKTFDDNLRIIRGLSAFSALESPLLLGPSNKAFIGHILDREPHERDTGTMAAVAACVLNGAHLVRVHNVKMAVETVRVIDAVKRGTVGIEQ